MVTVESFGCHFTQHSVISFEGKRHENDECRCGVGIKSQSGAESTGGLGVTTAPKNFMKH